MDSLVSKIVALESSVERLASVEERLARNDTLLSLANRIDNLDRCVSMVETSKVVAVVPVKSENGKHPPAPVSENIHEWNRLKLLAKFVSMSEKAREVELEWQRIQQDEHDFYLAFQTTPDENSKINYIFKKGIAEGIKWCVNRFS